LRPTLAAYRKCQRIQVVHASQAITMEDAPIQAVRQKKDSSLLVALRMLKEGQVDGVVSAGNTGAVMVAARTCLGPIRGVSRCAIGQALPTKNKPALLLDLGANVDCTARHLCEFAEMGMVFAKRAMKIEQPRVGLLNIGEERVKGNEVLKTAHKILAETEHLNFIGNVEPGALVRGVADVVVCDGFIGNLVLKTSEAMASLMGAQLKKHLTSSVLSRVGALFSLNAFRRMKRDFDPNEYFGAPLLGVNGTVIICHGASSARGISNAITGAVRAAEGRVNEHIREGIAHLRAVEESAAAGI
jgi:glycerol-3-phosphate acyltransferase PlsX